MFLKSGSTVLRGPRDPPGLLTFEAGPQDDSAPSVGRRGSSGTALATQNPTELESVQRTQQVLRAGGRLSGKAGRGVSLSPVFPA